MIKVTWFLVVLLPTLACGEEGRVATIGDGPTPEPTPTFTADRVQLDSGPVRGFEQDGAIAFKGVPYVGSSPFRCVN